MHRVGKQKKDEYMHLYCIHEYQLNYVSTAHKMKKNKEMEPKNNTYLFYVFIRSTGIYFGIDILFVP